MMLHAVVPQRLKIIPDFRALLFPERKDIHYIGGLSRIWEPKRMRRQESC